MKVIVSIDTSVSQQATVGLSIDGRKFVETQEFNTRKSQIVLPLIDHLLTKHHLTTNDITEIEVNVGPGSFTGLRVGIAIANTLGMLLQVPINGKKIGEQAEAHYE